MTSFHMQLGRAALALAATMALVSCGGGSGSGSGGIVPTSGVQLRALSPEFSQRKAVSYSPYRTIECTMNGVPVGLCAYDANKVLRALSNNAVAVATGNPPVLEPDSATFEANVKEDLDILVAGNFKLIRLFDSGKAAETVLSLIQTNKLDIKVMLGVYIASDRKPGVDKVAIAAANQEQIARGVALANSFQGTVLAVSVGNETMVSWGQGGYPIEPAVMAAHIKTVRSQITQPVTSDDNWAFYAESVLGQDKPRAIIDNIDFVAMHTYPLSDSTGALTWDWQQFGVPAGIERAKAMMAAAIASAQSDYAKVRAHLDRIGFSGMPIVIGETGWKAEPSNNELNRAHPVNHKMYFDSLNEWLAKSKQSGKGPVNIIYFEAFDEAWKISDNGWGLFNANRKARYAVQDIYTDKAKWETKTVDGKEIVPTYSIANALFAVDIIPINVTGDRYTLYADKQTPGETRSGSTPLDWYGWDSLTISTAYAGEESTPGVPVVGAPNGEEAHGIEILPVPKDWGWGILVAPQLATQTVDLSKFEATGRLRFSIKTTYPGPIEVGFLTGQGLTPSAYDVYMVISNTNADGYGYINDGNWHEVSVPISELKKNGNMAFGNFDPTKSFFDITKVTQPFVIGDRYANTGKANNFNNNTKIYVDNIYWSK